MFFEIIQRKRLRPDLSGGAKSFGKRLRSRQVGTMKRDPSGGNFKALSKAIEREQVVRRPL